VVGLAAAAAFRVFASAFRALLAADLAVLVTDDCPHARAVAAHLARFRPDIPVVHLDRATPPCGLDRLPGGLHRVLPESLSCRWLREDTIRWVDVHAIPWRPVWIEGGLPVGFARQGALEENLGVPLQAAPPSNRPGDVEDP